MRHGHALTSLMGATELLEGLRRLPRGTDGEQLVEAGDLMVTLQSAGGRKAAPGSLPPGVGPVGFYHSELVAEVHPGPRYALAGRRVLVLCEPQDAPAPLPGWITWTVASEGDRRVPRVTAGAPGGTAEITDALRQFGATPEAVLLVVDGARYPADALLGEALERLQGLLDTLFAACKQLYGAIAEGETRVAAVVCGAWPDGGTVHPITGLFGGFMKSLARDLPRAHLGAVHTDADLSGALAAAELAVADRAEGVLPELFLRRGVVLRPSLARTEVLCQPDTAPLVTDGMVVLATGGARGVTAVLLEALVAASRCKVVALGRTALEETPSELLELGEEALAAHEPQFYRDALARGTQRSIVELKREFQRHTAANEIFRNRKRLQALGGDLEYLATDITQAEAVDRAVGQVIAKYGRIDLVIHGAGTQISRAITGKSVPEFDSVVSAKLTGLRNLYRAVAARGLAGQVGFHLLTSAFSFWGNDGQPDYGAANEAMNRLAEAMSAGGGRWSTLAWLGWAGIGMTRGSEYAALAEQRGLYPVTKGEGQALFSALVQGAPAHAANILATPKEIAFYRVPVTETGSETSASLPATAEEPLELSIERAAYLGQHLVAGVPTVPGAVELLYSVRSALRVLGPTPGVEVRDARFLNFLKSYPGRTNRARVVARREPGSVAAQVAIESDFVHPSGRVLRTDVRNFEARISPLPEAPAVPPEATAVEQAPPGFFLLDPYIHGMGSVALSGVFDCLRQIAINDLGQTALFELPASLRRDPLAAVLAPAVLLDALWRLAVMRPAGSRIPLYVPAESRRVVLWSGGEELLARVARARLFATKPEPVAGEEGTVVIRHAVAMDEEGVLLAANTDIIAKASR